jgi:zinc transport system substrate-binding protein
MLQQLIIRGSQAAIYFYRTTLLLLAIATHNAAGQERTSVYTVNYPLQYFAERVAGDHADVICPVPSGIDPAFWQPDASDIAGYQMADLILLNGAGYANWINRVSLPRRKLVNTSAEFRDRYINESSAITHSHGLDGEHSHTGTAFTTWLDFNQSSMQARAIAQALILKQPELKDVFVQNLVTLETELLEFDTQIQSMVEGKQEVPLLASHPVYQYFQRRYKLNLRSVFWEANEMPGDQEWAVLEEALNGFPAQWMIWESLPDTRIVDRLGELGVEVIVFDPAANQPIDRDFLTVMEDNLNSLARIFK